MSDCKKIDKLLWSYPDISHSEKAELEQHLAGCAVCREAFETIKALGSMSETDKEPISAIDGAAFDAAVMRKIRMQKKPIAMPEKISNRYVLRMALSFALAASIVLFLVKSISDLSEIPTPFTTTQQSDNEKYNIINIELGKGQSQEPTRAMEVPSTYSGAPETKKAKTSKDRITLPVPSSIPFKDTNRAFALQPPPETTSGSAAMTRGETSATLASAADSAAQREQLALNDIKLTEQPSSIFSYESAPLTATKSAKKGIEYTQGFVRSRGGKAMSPPPVADAQPAGGEGFSILPSPMTAPSPDSVNIGAIYVTNENISLTQQTRAASLTEIYKDSGSVQVMMPQSSVLVTVEKMPKPLKIVMPEYPVWARKQGLTGTLWVRARVESDGHINNVEIVSCDAPGVGFEEEAIKAAKESIFTPASANGMNLPVWIVYPVKFIYKE